MGWSIGNVILDFAGGLFSLLQLIIEAIGNGRPIIQDGAFNVVKFALSLLSIVYNIIFLIQHYVLYGEKAKGKAADEDAEGRLNPSSRDTSTDEVGLLHSKQQFKSTSMHMVVDKETSLRTNHKHGSSIDKNFWLF